VKGEILVIKAKHSYKLKLLTGFDNLSGKQALALKKILQNVECG
jgi:hypothetical protein